MRDVAILILHLIVTMVDWQGPVDSVPWWPNPGWSNINW